MLGFEPVSVLPRVPEVPDPPMRERPLEIVLNAPAADAQRRPSAAQAVELADGATSGIDQLGRAAAAGDVAALGHLYDELLGPIYRYIAVRVHRREAAQVMGRRAGTIRGLTFRAIGALRRHLNEDAE